jgi:hypothetical protein
MVHLAIGLLRLQFSAIFTGTSILASSGSVNSFSTKAAGYMAPSSKCASSAKPTIRQEKKQEKSTQHD